MSSSFWLLEYESHDFAHAEKEWTACKAEQIHKVTIIFTQNGPKLLFWVKILVNLPSFAKSSLSGDMPIKFIGKSFVTFS